MPERRGVTTRLKTLFQRPALFVLAGGINPMPGYYDDVVRLLVPELQRRGLFHRDRSGPTLRDNLGLPIPRAVRCNKARPQPGTSSPNSGAYCCPP